MSLVVETPRSRLKAELITAYRTARYRVEAGFDLMVDAPSAALAAWHTGHNASCSALITACNPGSEVRPESWNRAATRQLEVQLSRHRLAFSPTLALDPNNQWPAEQGFLVAGLTREPAEVMGRRLQQNAIVWAGADAVPRLILLR